VLKNLNNKQDAEKYRQLLAQNSAQFKQLHAGQEVKSLPEFTDYIVAYEQMGISLKNFAPSAYAMAKRLLAGNDLPDINPLVNLYNALSVKYLIPLGGHDLRNISDDIELRMSRAGDAFKPMFSPDAATEVEPDHLVLASGSDVLTDHWVWRQSEFTKIDADSDNVLMLFDTMGHKSNDFINQMIDEFSQLLGANATIEYRSILDAQNSEMELDVETQVSKSPKVNLITQNLAEVIGETDLQTLVANGTKLNHYIGFEISGLVHLGTGLSSMLKIRDLQQAGVDCTVFLADWHTWINDKLGGDHELIKRVATEYFQPAMEASAQIVGADPAAVRFVHGTQLYHANDRYWQTMVEISKNLTLSRVLKSTSIMGRDERESQPFAWLIYPPMQAADVFEMGTNIVHAGMDQRKIHVIAREVAMDVKINPLRDINGKQIKPVALHHNLLLGLQAPKTWPVPAGAEKDTIRTEMKMSKSIPGSAIFIHDSEEEVRSKIRKAFCPEKELDLNPIIDWVKHVILPIVGEIKFKREERFGGDFTVDNFAELAERYSSGELFPLDLKNNVADVLVDLLRPARDRFSDDSSAELIEQIRGIKKTR
jgi:tyrosyl-tRNA synthetase